MKRPLGLTVIAWLAIVGGGLQILGSLGLVGVGALGVFIGSTGAIEGLIFLNIGLEIWTGAVLMLLGALGVVFGLGALAQRPWAWTMGIVLYGLNLLAGVALLLGVGFGWTYAYIAVLSAVIVGYMYSPTAREAMGHPTHGGISGQTPHTA